MKHFKRILCVLLSLLMTLPLAIASVGATESETPTVKPGTVLYAQDFENVENGAAVKELFPNTATNYAGFYEFSMPADVFGHGGTKSAKLWPSGTWAYPTICTADALQGQSHYTIKMDFQGNFNSEARYFGIRFAGYSDTTREGHYIKFGYGNYVYPSYINASGTVTKLGKNGGENTGVAEFNWTDKMTFVVDVDSANKTADIYLQSSVSKNKTLTKIHTMTLQTSDISSIHFCAEGGSNGTAIIDNISITAGGINDVPTAAYGVQTTAVNNEGKYDMRFVGAFNGNVENAQKVGFKVVASWNDGAAQTKTFNENTAKVYTSIKANNGNRVVTADECDGDYLFALTVTGIPTEYPVTFTMTPYVITANGSTIYGAAKTVVATYSEGILTVTPAENVITPAA